MSKTTNRYVDEFMNVHIRDTVVGQGGQGIVFRTKDPDLAVKLITDESGNPVTDSGSIEKYSRRLSSVRLLPLPDNINISVPAAVLRDQTGYVMQLLSEMKPLSSLMHEGKPITENSTSDIPKWLDMLAENEARKIMHYCDTGGLRRRLEVLSKCSAILARLHGRGLVYGDLSPGNIFVSEDVRHSFVWLIDADNIRFEVELDGSAMYTPRYGAPEIVQGVDCGRSSSDCYSFAIVAFYLISLVHPFCGKLLDEEDELDWAEESGEQDIEEQAFSGLLPWIDDIEDDSNYSSKGLPRALVLSEELKAIFQKTFTLGRTSPSLRPRIFHWPELLARATDATIKCPSCKMSYYSQETTKDNFTECPYCGTPKPATILLKSFVWHGENVKLNEACWAFEREFENSRTIGLPNRVFDEFKTSGSDNFDLELTITKEDVLLSKTEESKLELSIAKTGIEQGSFTKITSKKRLLHSQSGLEFWLLVNSDIPRMIHCTIGKHLS